MLVACMSYPYIASMLVTRNDRRRGTTGHRCLHTAATLPWYVRYIKCLKLRPTYLALCSLIRHADACIDTHAPTSGFPTYKKRLLLYTMSSYVRYQPCKAVDRAILVYGAYTPTRATPSQAQGSYSRPRDGQKVPCRSANSHTCKT